MALFIRSIQPVPATRRAYSSFFSSKSGGGRYFNSAKPPKAVVPTGSGASKVKADASGSASPDAGHGSQLAGGANAVGSNKGNNQQVKGATKESNPAQDPPLSQPKPPPPSSSSSSSPSSLSFMHTMSIHPAVNPKDYKLHQFFSLHRPLLLLAQPTSIIFDSPQSTPLSASLSSHTDGTKPEGKRVPAGTLDDPPEASPEADADAARQLVRSLVMNRAGAAMAWEHTLRGLGLDVDLEEGRAGLKEQWAREWHDMMMDSTKRKRKKKMKKHKLRKRRRATRAQRLKTG